MKIVRNITNYVLKELGPVHECKIYANANTMEPSLRLMLLQNGMYVIDSLSDRDLAMVSDIYTFAFDSVEGRTNVIFLITGDPHYATVVIFITNYLITANQVHRLKHRKIPVYVSSIESHV